MNLGIIQEGEQFFFQIETADKGNLRFNQETGKHEITIGPFSKEKYTAYTGLDKLPAALPTIDQVATVYSGVPDLSKVSDVIPVKESTDAGALFTGTPSNPLGDQVGYIADRTEYVSETPYTASRLILEPSTQKPMSDLVQRDPIPIEKTKSSAPLLDWDMDTEFTPAQPVNEKIFEKAKEAISNIDITEAEKELASQAQAVIEGKLPKAPAPIAPATAFTPKTFEQFQEKAIENIKELDKQLAEGGRVNVADKYILNCQADLNQLVPFKYGWAWSDYLNACDKHWMPPEYNLEASATAFHDGTLKASHKAIITKAWYTDQYHQMLLPIQTVLNAYRHITNPECRQYTLRQAFELSLKKHAWLHLSETMVGEGQTFASHVIDKHGTKSFTSLMNINDTLKDRFTLVKDNMRELSSDDFSTQGVDNVRTFVFEMMVAFGYVNYIMLLPAYYQVMNLERTGLPTNGVSRLFEMMVKDIKAQSENLKRLIPTILEENPGVLDQDLHDKLVKFFKKAVDLELDIISLCSTSDQDFASISHLLQVETSSMLASMGVTFPEKRLPQNTDHQWFAALLAKHSPAVHNTTSVTGTGGSLEF